MKVKELMVKKVITVKEEVNVKEICKMLNKLHMSGLPVVNKPGKLVGFVSERDVIAAVPKPNFINRTAKQIMSRKIRTIQDDAPITHASKIFSQEKYRQLPVTHNGKLVGIIARRDVLNHMLGHYY